MLAGLPIALVLYMWFMLISSTMDEINKLEKEKEALRGDIENIKRSMNPALLKNLSAQKEQLTMELENKKAELTALVGTIPTQKEGGLMLREIGRLARKNGVSLLSVQVQSPQKVVYVLETTGDKKLVKEAQPQTQQQAQQPQQQASNKPSNKPSNNQKSKAWNT